MVYELGYKGEGSDGGTFSMGLIDVSQLKYDPKKSGFEGQKSGVNEQKSGVSDNNQQEQKKQVAQDKKVATCHHRSDGIVQ
ncbi:MAG: hypothetical protein H8D23_30885 [Candidatus Brocadiales bacterium]|nr:hypothetical protein [Candidatus Brocadiales bacterium]